jgi:hypothetical protein
MEIGVVGRPNEPLQGADVNAMRLAKISAVKVSHLGLNEDFFTVYTPPSGDNYAKKVKEAYDQGVRWFLIHKYPNWQECGFGHYWHNGKEFARWWIDIWGQLISELPEAKIGVPAMKAGSSLGSHLADSEQFFEECFAAVNAAHFYELETKWGPRDEMKTCLWRIDTHIRLWPDKPLIVTFCNTNSGVAKEDKGRQYVEFYRRLEERPNVHAAFAYCISSSDKQDLYVTWRGEKGQKPNRIPEIVGQRI